MRWIVAALLAAVLVPSVGAQDADAVELTIEGRNTGCEAGKTYCFVVTSGSMADLAPGSDVRVHFINADQSSPHEFLATTSDKAKGGDEDTARSDAVAQSEQNLPPNGEDYVNFTIPDDASGIYFWCGVAGHERLGMWLEQGFRDESTPSPAWAALIALAAAALVAARRRA